ncbi:unnamed protein product [Nippostrongylus brasiliensis]|uniref:HAP1 N-terminal domain-containing protein n=1 Tax=Nippostrongylus brasiliensis TaxID=27835 RepID=A0A0N4Y9A5_NIPBR|nr:unnamed protein product [Nippostrongylus brasiliensis]
MGGLACILCPGPLDEWALARGRVVEAVLAVNLSLGWLPIGHGSQLSRIFLYKFIVSFQKDRDLEIAAKIGQSLLEQNRDLQQRTEFLEESLAKSSEEMIQMKHEETTDDSLKKRLEKTKLENIQLKHDVFSMRKEMEAQIERDRKRYEEVSRQFELAQQQIVSLHSQVVERGEDYAAQSVVVEKLLREISLKCHRERELTAENADLSRQVDDALLRQNELGMQMKELQVGFILFLFFL